MKESKPRPKIQLGKLHRGPQQYGKSYYQLFSNLASFYAEARMRLDESPISSSCIDPLAPRPVKWSLLAEWCCDFERIIEKTCKNDLKLQEIVIALLRETAGFGRANVTENQRYRAIQKLGYALENRGLNPRQYFRVKKKRRKKEEK